MTVITLSQIKTNLGITTTDSDAALTAILPALDAKVKEITRNRWNLQLRAELDGTKYARVYTIGNDPFLDAYPSNSRSIGVDWRVEDIHEYLAPGLEVTGDGIPSGAYIADVFSLRRTVGGKTYAAPSIELSDDATASGAVDIVAGFNRAYHPIVAKLAWWMVSDQSTDTPAGGIASESVGDISVSYSTAGADLDGRHGVPAWAVRGLPRYGRGY